MTIKELRARRYPRTTARRRTQRARRAKSFERAPARREQIEVRQGTHPQTISMRRFFDLPLTRRQIRAERMRAASNGRG